MVNRIRFVYDHVYLQCIALFCRPGCSESSLPTNLTLLRANEVDEVLNGDDEKYRALTINSESATSRA